MLTRLFPAQIDNRFQGSRLALWLFGLILLLTSAISVNSIFNGHTVAQRADGIPLDTYSPAAAQAVVAMFAAWGLSQLLLRLLGLLALIRYRALVPLLYLVLLADAVLRRLIFLFLPIARVPGPPGLPTNLVLIALIAIGLILSLLPPRPAMSN